MQGEKMNSSAESIADQMIKKLRMEEEEAAASSLQLGVIEEKDDSDFAAPSSLEAEGGDSPTPSVQLDNIEPEEVLEIPEWLRPTTSYLERPPTGSRRRQPGMGLSDSTKRPLTAFPTSDVPADKPPNRPPFDLLPPRPGTSSHTRVRPQTSSGRTTSQLDFFGIPKNSDAKKAIEDHGLRETLQGTLQSDSLLTILESKGRESVDALQLAADKGDLALVKSLLAKGVKANSAGSLDSFTPLHHAANRGHVEVVRALLTAGADSDVTNRSAETPLHLACYGGHVDVVAALLEAGADVDAKNEYDETPLFYATRKDHCGVIKYLLQRGADTTIRNRLDDLAIDEAISESTKAAFITKEIREKGLGKLDFKNLIAIFTYLDNRELCKCACLSSKWRRAADDSSVWKERGVQKWNLSLQSALGMEQAPMVNMFRPSSSRSLSARLSSSRSSSRGQTPEVKLR